MSESLAEELGWRHVSTDSLARHPGRPWALAHEEVPDHVAKHYLCLSVHELIEDVLRHYRANVWPQVEKIVASHLNNPSTAGIVVEGSALWPEFATSLDFNQVSAIWLTAREDVFRRRIHVESMYSSKSRREQMMIDKFFERTIAYDERMVDSVNRLEFPLLHVRSSNVTELTQRCLSILGVEDLQSFT